MSTVTIAATAEPNNSPPRIRLDITDIGAPENFSVNVTRLDPDGRLVPVRTYDGNPLTLVTSGLNRVGVLYDYEMPYGALVQYSTTEDPTSSSGEVSVASSQVWLVHPGVPSLSAPIELRINSLAEEELPVAQIVLYPMGRANPVVVNDGVRRGVRSSLTVGTETLAEVAALRSLVSDAGTLFLNIPAAMGLGVDPCYIAVSDVTISRLTSIGSDPQRDVRMPFVVVDRPAGGTTAERTYADLMTFATYADVQAAYPSYLALLAGP